MDGLLVGTLLAPLLLILSALSLRLFSFFLLSIERVGRGFYDAPEFVESVALNLTTFFRTYLEDFYGRDGTSSFKSTQLMLMALLIAAIANWAAAPAPVATKASKPPNSKKNKDA